MGRELDNDVIASRVILLACLIPWVLLGVGPAT